MSVKMPLSPFGMPGSHIADDLEALVLVKGADSVLLPMCNDVRNVTDKHLSRFANHGLRTLVFASKRVNLKKMIPWIRLFNEAKCAMRDRDAQLDAAFGKLLVDMNLLGVAALEDKLQDGVHGTLSALHQAGIQTVMLTGDKMETAVKIGHNCGLLRPSTQIFTLPDDDMETADGGGERDKEEEKMDGEMDGEMDGDPSSEIATRSAARSDDIDAGEAGGRRGDNTPVAAGSGAKGHKGVLDKEQMKVKTLKLILRRASGDSRGADGTEGTDGTPYNNDRALVVSGSSFSVSLTDEERESVCVPLCACVCRTCALVV